MTYALRLHIHLDEPLLATGVANGEENSSISLDYIPGSALRGTCTTAYLHRHNTDDLAADDVARRLFFTNEVCFLNGYPALPTNTALRAIPCPASWHMDKDDADNDRREVRDYAFEEAEKFEKSKAEGRTFYWPGDEPRSLQSPRRWTNVHNASLENPMLKREGDSNVFRYVALDRGQDFVAYVVAGDRGLLEEVEKCLPFGRLHLGGSQTAGYGLVTVATASETNWQETARDYDVDEFTIITLLSDALLRDKTGRPTTDFHEVLRTTLGKPKGWQPRKIFAHVRLVGGFNRKWGLPLAQRWAVTMGSTFVYAADDLSLDELASLLQKGIGDRRNEGFGRLGVNLNSKETFMTTTPTAAVPVAQPLSLTSEAVAQKMARRRLMQAVETATLRHVNTIDFERERCPQNTQLSRLRLVVRQAQRKNDLSLVSKHLTTMKKPAADQFARHRLNVPRYQTPVTWEQWLRDRARKRDGFRQIELRPDEAQWQIAGRPPTVDEPLQVEVTCMLIEALLRKALKEEQQDG